MLQVIDTTATFRALASFVLQILNQLGMVNTQADAL